MSTDEARPPAGRALHFEKLFHACYPRVLGYAIRRTDDRAAAEEAASETFLVAWRRLDDIPSESLPWLLGVARKVLANQRRAAGRRSSGGPIAPLDAVADPDPRTAVADHVADREAFAAAFGALTPRDREVLVLISWDGLAPREAAIVLGCSSATFSLRLHRARKRLLKELDARGHSFGERAVRSIGDQRRDAPEAG